MVIHLLKKGSAFDKVKPEHCLNKMPTKVTEKNTNSAIIHKYYGNKEKPLKKANLYTCKFQNILQQSLTLQIAS